jgi:2-polyprenyl-6-methoxyphenol hydroxylase-like FAD-dependent oxidoreductase
LQTAARAANGPSGNSAHAIVPHLINTLKFEDVSDRAITNLKVNVQKVNWLSTYHVHHRVTEHFRKGRAFLLGDAAHIPICCRPSPVRPRAV